MQKQYKFGELTDTQERYLNACVEILDQRSADVEPVCFFCGEGDDESVSLCYDCIYQVPRVPIDAHSNDIARSAWGESDSPERCEECGKLLSYTLTDYGVKEELGYFAESENAWDWNSPNDCFELARIAHAVWTVEQRRELIKVLRKGKNKPKFS